MKQFLFIVLQFVICTLATAQQKLEGQLVDQATQQPVSFASIVIQEKTAIGAISNEDGYFRLEVKELLPSDSIRITHINYTPVNVSVQALHQQAPLKILLTENSIHLGEVLVHATEDYAAFEDVVTQTKKSLRFPMTSTVYYRELVKENKSFNKFADGLLTVAYDKHNDDNDMKIRVDQCRTEKLEKDEDDQFELISPVKPELVLGMEFGNFLNRFREENQVNYHYYALPGDPNTGEKTLIIEPKKEADRSDDKLLYRATLKITKNNVIREASIEIDSLCHYEKSILGIKFAFIKSKTLLSFRETDGLNYLSFVRANIVMTITTKKYKQTEDFISEFVTLRAVPEAVPIAKADVYKKSALYKHDDLYSSPFWNNINIPAPTAEEEKLIGELGNKVKAKANSK